MNILVVGGAGYVGGGIVDLLSKKHNVTVYDSLIYENSFRKEVDFLGTPLNFILRKKDYDEI